MTSGSKRHALITGISGQDGSYLARRLCEEGFKVTGFSRSGRGPECARIHALDLTDTAGVRALVEAVRPEECYHLATFHRSSAARAASEQAIEEMTFRINIEGTRTLLGALRDFSPACRVFLAGSCQMFGDTRVLLQTRQTAFEPNNVYALSKVLACEFGRLLRRKGDLYCTTGILFNHESPLRGPEFVTTRIAQAAVRIHSGQEKKLVVGNLGIRVDWGFAGDYVRAMTLAVRANQANDYIIATGRLHSIEDLVRLAFGHLCLNWSDYVEEDPAVFQRRSTATYCGDPAETEQELGWKREVDFEHLVPMLVEHHRQTATRAAEGC